MRGHGPEEACDLHCTAEDNVKLGVLDHISFLRVLFFFFEGLALWGYIINVGEGGHYY